MIEILLVFAGIHFMIEWLAACYRIMDLWYDIQCYWRAVLTRLGVITGLGIVMLIILPSAYAHYFTLGAISYVFIHLGVWLTGRLIGYWLQHQSR